MFDGAAARSSDNKHHLISIQSQQRHAVSLCAILLASDSICAIARHMPSPVRLAVCLAVCLSVCPSHGWISQRRLKLGSCNLHHRVATWL